VICATFSQHLNATDRPNKEGYLACTINDLQAPAPRPAYRRTPGAPTTQRCPNSVSSVRYACYHDHNICGSPRRRVLFVKGFGSATSLRPNVRSVPVNGSSSSDAREGTLTLTQLLTFKNTLVAMAEVFIARVYHVSAVCEE
jgi:hypothetical protein